MFCTRLQNKQTSAAAVVFHPHFHEAEPGSYRPTTFADPANTFLADIDLTKATGLLASRYRPV